MPHVKPPRKAETAPLTAREAAFVREYLADPIGRNGTQAAIRAGYAEGSAKVAASRLLTRGNVRAAIERGLAKVAEVAEEKHAITLERVVEEMAKIAFANQLDYVKISPDGEPYIDLSAMTREQAAAISETYVEDVVEGRGDKARTIRKVRVKFHDKKGALEALGRHFGGFRSNVNLDVQKDSALAALMSTITRSALSVRPSTPEEPA